VLPSVYSSLQKNAAATEAAFAKAPKLKAIAAGVAANEKIATYVAQRKVTEN
jgi:hypothetical protein